MLTINTKYATVKCCLEKRRQRDRQPGKIVSIKLVWKETHCRVVRRMHETARKKKKKEEERGCNSLNVLEFNFSCTCSMKFKKKSEKKRKSREEKEISRVNDIPCVRSMKNDWLSRVKSIVVGESVRLSRREKSGTLNEWIIWLVKRREMQHWVSVHRRDVSRFNGD